MAREYVKVFLTGELYWAFINEPRPADKIYEEKGPRYELDLVDFQVVPNPVSPFKDNEDLRKHGIKAKTYDYPSDHKNADLDGRSFLKMQSKVGSKDNPREIDPKLAESRKPRVIDSNMDPIASGVLVGNGSKVLIRASVPKDLPEKGRKQELPRPEVIQVIEMKEYVRPEGSGFFGMEKIQGGYTVDTATLNDDQSTDPFAGLESPEDLAETTANKPKPKAARKAA